VQSSLRNPKSPIVFDQPACGVEREPPGSSPDRDWDYELLMAQTWYSHDVTQARLLILATVLALAALALLTYRFGALD
jgi:hypothetical protein